MPVLHDNLPAIMVDIETLGTAAGSVITSIAAVKWYPHDGTITDEFKVNISIASSLKHGMTIDGKTLAWWMDQDTAARRAQLSDPVELVSALASFASWLREHEDCHPAAPLPIWGHGATFDVPLITVAYERIGAKVPWHYRAPRDTRTLFALAGYEPAKTHAEHVALDDAKAQCGWVTEALQKLRA